MKERRQCQFLKRTRRRRINNSTVVVSCYNVVIGVGVLYSYLRNIEQRRLSAGQPLTTERDFSSLDGGAEDGRWYGQCIW